MPSHGYALIFPRCLSCFALALAAFLLPYASLQCRWQNAIGHVTLALQEPLVTLPFAQSRILGALVLVDTASHKTSGAVLVN